jgi:hydroxymethylpyrimidine pyrophosphatase-like HAD family hydrolase
MPYRYRAFAIDYDGTLTAADQPHADVLAAVAAVRKSGRRVILVTGRIMDELLAVFPDVLAHFDHVVAENGCVLVEGGGGRTSLAPEIDAALSSRLQRMAVPHRRGQVLIATQARHSARVLKAIEELGLELQLIQNRSELMIVPSGINKGTGLLHALAELGVNRHNVVAIGDAENDHSLFAACEIGVAVDNAVDSLKEHAEILLTQSDGFGVAAFLNNVLRGDLALAQPTRWNVVLGEYEDGSPVLVPAAAVAIGIFGESGRGKSFLAGLLAERLIQLEYRVCVIDPEGDHAGLAELPGVVRIGGANPLPAVADVVHILVRTGAGVVVDMAQHDVNARASYARDLARACQVARERYGMPHCLIVDEAHVMFGHADTLSPVVVDSAGTCLVTFRPEMLHPGTLEGLDVTLTVRSTTSATLQTADDAVPRHFTPSGRISRHARHIRKYALHLLPLHRRFYFRQYDELTGRSAANLREFRDEIGLAPTSVVIHHARNGDVSRWVGDLCRDPELATAIAGMESALSANPTVGGVTRFRDELSVELEDRFLL